VGAQYKDNIITVGSLKAAVFIMNFFDSNVKRVYEEIKAKPAYNETNIVFLNTKLVFGLEHILGIMRILNEGKKRNSISDIKNIEIEFLMRLCCTDQISEALKVNFGDKSNKDYVVIILSDNDQKLKDIEKEFEQYGSVISNNKSTKTKNDSGINHRAQNMQDKNDELIAADNTKREFIINMFFKEKIKDPNSELLKSDTKFLKFLIERAAISLK
jgi:tRNA threonylcarbamoyladenosine modification (KEOPS) complex Cgi121 subunit